MDTKFSVETIVCTIIFDGNDLSAITEKNCGEVVSVEDNRAGNRISLKIWPTNNSLIEGLLGGSSQLFSSRTPHWGRIQMQSNFEGL